MSMYNAIFGTNPASGALLGMLGLSASDVGRFRDTFVTEEDGEPVIAVYTRNGGGNREHSAWDDHSQYRREIGFVKRCQWNYSTSQWDNIQPDCALDHDPVAVEGPDCDCTGCTITYKIPQLSGYLRDTDDDFDCTYATVFFKPPDDYRDLLSSIVREGSPDDDWRDFLSALQDEPENPTTRPQKLAVKLIASLQDKP